MPVHATRQFEDDLRRTIYEFVERRGAVTMDDLVREVRIDDGPAQSKPPRSGNYGHRVTPPVERLREAVETLTRDGYLTERGGTIQVALPVSPAEHDLESGTVRLRPARESDRDDLLETMREVASDGPYVVGENVADRVARESALVRRNDERSRAFFVAVRAPAVDEAGERAGDDATDRGETAGDGSDDLEASGASDAADAADASDTSSASETNDEGSDDADEPGEAAREADTAVVGWLHVEAPQLPTLRHTAELTVGVHPDHRREGIGSNLLAYGLEWADEAGYRKICQRVPATNDGAIAFLEANGWEREGVREEQYRIDDEYVDEVLLATWPSR